MHDAPAAVTVPAVPAVSGTAAGGAPSRAATFVSFALALGALLAYVLVLDRAGWSDAGAMALQQAVERLRDAPGPRLSLFGLLHPHVPVFVVWVLQSLPGLDVATAQLAAVVALGAWTVARWHRRLARATPGPLAWVVLALVLANPWVGWALTASLPSVLALAAFLGLCFAVIELVDDDAPQALMRVAGWLLLMFFVDARAVWIALGLAPMFALVRPRARAYGAADRVAEPAPLGAILLVVYLPLLFAFGSWCYVNWLFVGDPLHWIAADAARGADDVRHAIDAAAAPSTAAGWLVATGASALLLAAAFPVAALLVLSARRGTRRAGWALAMVPVVAALLATAFGQAPDPAQVLSLAAGTVLAGLCRGPAGEGAGGTRTASFQAALLGLLALGAVAAWGLALHGPSVFGGSGVRGWAEAVASAGMTPAPAPVPAPAAASTAASTTASGGARAAAPSDGPGDRTGAPAPAKLAQALAQWAEAWSGQRVDDYLAFYDQSFETPDGAARDVWETQRRERLVRPARIRVRLDEIEVSVDGIHGRTRFVQTWSVPGRSTVDRKTLRWVLRDGRWRIVRERATPLATEAPSVETSAGSSAGTSAAPGGGDGASARPGER